MNITLMNNLSEKTRLIKEHSQLYPTTGILKSECSVVNPVFLIDQPVDVLLPYNYIDVPSFNRKYFITNMVAVNNRLTEVTAEVDVLSSFANEIMANKAVVYRTDSDNFYNMYIDDGSIKTYQNPLIYTHVFPNGFDATSKYSLLLAGKSPE